MSTIAVWVFIAYFDLTGYHAASGGPVVIDNIATKADCMELVADIGKSARWSACREVKKAAVK
jgi:GH25 family lysozyme M1 (1,4-beta-N-acetylmuramidase)